MVILFPNCIHHFVLKQFHGGFFQCTFRWLQECISCLFRTNPYHRWRDEKALARFYILSDNHSSAMNDIFLVIFNTNETARMTYVSLGLFWIIPNNCIRLIYRHHHHHHHHRTHYEDRQDQRSSMLLNHSCFWHSKLVIIISSAWMEWDGCCNVSYLTFFFVL